MQAVPDTILTFKVSEVRGRVMLLGIAVCIIIGSYFAIKWCVASTFAEYPLNLEVAQAALRWSPSDPRVHYAVGRFAEKQSAQTGAGDYGVPEFERAVGLSPFDYRLWLRLASAREHAGKFDESARAFQRAIELAPAYADTHWEYGNFLLRRNRYVQAFARLRRAGELNQQFLPQIFNLASRIYEGDFARALSATSDSNNSRATLIPLLIKQERTDDARRLWAGLTTDEQRANRDSGAQLMRALFAQKNFVAAFEIYRQLHTGAAEAITPEQLIDGGFEADVANRNLELFGWRVAPQEQAQVYLDQSTSHGGARSLCINFNAPREFTFPEVAQMIVIAPGKRYQLEFYYLTLDLKTAATLHVELLDANSGRVLIASPPVATGLQDWQRIAVEFRTAPDVRAVTLRLARNACATAPCPMYGRVWLDDFRLSGM